MKDTKNGAKRRFSGRLLAKLTNRINKITQDEPARAPDAQAASWGETAACHADEPRQAVDTKQAK